MRERKAEDGEVQDRTRERERWDGGRQEKGGWRKNDVLSHVPRDPLGCTKLTKVIEV